MSLDDTQYQLDVGPLEGKQRTVCFVFRDRFHTDRFDVLSDAKRSAFVGRAESRFELETGELDFLHEAIVQESVRVDDEHREQAETSDDGDPLEQMSPTVKAEAEAFLQGERLVESLANDIEACGVAGEQTMAMTLYLIGTSRLLAKPMAGIVQAASSSGKSYVIDRVSRMFPPEAVVRATQMSQQSLFYMEPGSLSHKFVVTGERSRLENDDTAEGTRALREMLSGGEISKRVVMKIGGEMKTVQIEQPGPIAYVESTTLTQIFDEDRNRALLLHCDESEKQTQAILQQMAKHYATGSGSLRTTFEKHHAVQRMLKSFTVVVPYAERIANSINTARTEIRRAFPMLIACIQASALLHQKQRRIDADARVIADVFDYELARQLLIEPLAEQLADELSQTAKQFYEWLKTWATGEFTHRECVDRGKGDGAVKNNLRLLRRHGSVKITVERAGPNPAKYRLGPPPGRKANIGLPEPDDLVADKRKEKAA